MKFVKATLQDAEQAVYAALDDALRSGKAVLWLVSGGSNIASEVSIMSRLAADLSQEQLSRLQILPMDERYGKPGHKDSNTQALVEAGFEPAGANLAEILQEDLSLEATAMRLGRLADDAAKQADVIIGQFGLGSDAHTAGLLPGSLATESTAEAQSAVGYQWSDYQRVTLTAGFLRQVKQAFVLAFGENKRTALQRLQAADEPFADLPARVLDEIDATVFSDAL